MADNQKYYYMRIKEDFFDSNEMKVLESMQDGYLYSNILLKLYLCSLKDNGRLMFNNRIPYSPQMIATITRHQVGTVDKALNIFKQMELIEVLDTGAIYMLNIQEFIGKSSTEADRKRRYRDRIDHEKSALIEHKSDENINNGTNVGQMSGQMVGHFPPEIEIELEKEIEINKNNNTPQQDKPVEDMSKKKKVKHKYGEYKHVLLTDDQYDSLISSYPNYEELIKYLDEYIEMKGYKAKNHYLAIKKWVVDAVSNKSNKFNQNVGGRIF